MPTLRLALAQLNLTVGDLAGNRRLIEGAIQRAEAWMADVVVVPELAVTGYPPEDLLLKPRFIQANQEALEGLKPAARSVIAVVGYVDRHTGGALYNAAAVLANGRQVATYRKQCLPNYGVFDERRYFQPGAQGLVLAIGNLRLGVTICEDLWEEFPARAVASAGAHLLLNLSASPYHAGKRSQRERRFAATARRNNLAIAYCNLVGGQDELIFDGASLVLDARGRLLAQGAQFREDLVLIDLPASSLGQGARSTAQHPVQTVAIHREIQERPVLPRSSVIPYGPVEEVYEALVLGLRDYVRKNGFSTVTLGISGGVDSALTACLAVDALGADHVVGLVMPSRFSSRQTQEDARALARALGIRFKEISIEPMFQAYVTVLAPHFTGRTADVTEQNIQARIRGNLLMACSNKFGWLVLTTGNKSELATGYTTLYGDMAGGFAVIKDVPKTLVYELARFRNHRGARPPIPPRVLSRPPTAELAPHQRDQDTLPPYELRDRLITSYVEEDRSLPEILTDHHVDAATAKRVLEMVDRSEYKRRQGPPGIKITPKAFGKDRRMPITNRYRDH